MPFLNEQITIINNALRLGPLNEQRFQEGQFGGLAVTVHETTERGTIQYPVAENEEHEVRYMGVDDTYPLVIYHRVLDIAYATVKGSVGDGNNHKAQVANMVMVVYGKRQQLRLTASQLEALICVNFPDAISGALIQPLKLSNMEVRIQASNLNALQVFAQEYGGNEVFIGPEDILFSVRYQIESRYRKGCFNTCDCVA